MTQEAEMTALETLRISLKGHENLEEMIQYIKNGYKVAELEELAKEAGIENPGDTKAELAEQLIAFLSTGDDANIEGDADDASDQTPDADGDAEPATASDEQPDDQATSDGSVLTEDGQAVGVSLPAKVASYRPEQLWPQILGWEIDQRLDEDARAAFNEDQLREYLAYLWMQVNMGRSPRTCLRISEYEFVGLRDA